MAEIVLAAGTSHSPMLLTPPEQWGNFRARDEQMTLIDNDGRPRGYAELAAAAAGRFDDALGAAAFTAVYDACQAALDRLAVDIAAASLDAVIIIGDDQKELFVDDLMPAILVYRGESVHLTRREPRPGEAAWWSDTRSRYYARGEDEHYPVRADLARHLIESLMAADFDPADSTRLPRGRGIGHAFAFVHTRLLKRAPIPVVPVFLNTYFPPNQPTPRRCLGLGAAIRDAVATWPHSARVAVIASGGLSHFCINASLDRAVLAAMTGRDGEWLASLSPAALTSGTSEIRNWIAMYGAADHLDAAWSEYQPAYRTPAGTGTGCAFAVWK